MKKGLLAVAIATALMVGCGWDPEPKKYARKCLKSETYTAMMPGHAGLGGIPMGGMRMVTRTRCVKYSEYFLTKRWAEWNERQKMKPKKD